VRGIGKISGLQVRPWCAVIAAAGLALVACTDAAPDRTDVPEPATAAPLTVVPVGRVFSVPGTPEGLAVSAAHGLVAVGVRGPDGVVLVDLATGRQRRMVRLSGAPRHLQLAGAAGPVLVPAEGADRLYTIALPEGRVLADVGVGRQPHDAAAAGDVIFVSDEFADTVSIVRGGRRVAVVPAPAQPGGVAASADGAVALVVGVRGRQVQAYAQDGRSLGSAPAGVGPTHVRAGRGRLFYVADTQGGAVLVFEAGPGGLRQVGEAATAAPAPYGLAVDVGRERLYVTLTGTNQVQSFRVSGQRLIAQRVYPAVRQPNDVAVDPVTGRVVVAGTADGVLQVIDPAR
jgi:DNA-binding beta-propeller fold protein YncE